MALPYGQFNHANLVYARVTSAVAPGTDYILQQEAAVRVVGVNSQVVNIKLPVLATSPFGPSIYFISWNGLGTLNFAVVAGSTDTIVAPATTFAEASPVNRAEFIVLALDNIYKIIVLPEGSATGAVSVRSPNVQLSSYNTVDAGHGGAAGTLHFAATAGTAAPTLATGAICLGNAAGRSHGAGSITIGDLSSNAGADSVAIGVVGAGLVGQNSQFVGQAGGVGEGSAVVGSVDDAGDGCAVVGGALDVADGGCVLGFASNNVPAGAIVLGTGAASATAQRLNLLGLEAVVVEGAPLTNNRSLAVNINGTAYKIMLTEVANATPIPTLPLAFMTMNLNGNERYVPVRDVPSWNDAAGSGTVTSVGSGTGLTGGPITTTGTLSLASIANNTVLGNNSGSSTAPTAKTGTEVTAMLDLFATGATTKGLVPGSNSAGATAYLNGNGGWTVPPGTGITIWMSAQRGIATGTAATGCIFTPSGGLTSNNGATLNMTSSDTWNIYSTITPFFATFSATAITTTVSVNKFVSNSTSTGGSILLEVGYLNFTATSTFTSLSSATIPYNTPNLATASSLAVTWTNSTVTLPAGNILIFKVSNNLTGGTAGCFAAAYIYK